MAGSQVYHAPNDHVVKELSNIANRIRVNSVRSTSAAKSGHPTSSTSAADLLSVLFFHTMKFHPNDPRNPSDDRFVLSKGHACPALYSAWLETGHISDDDLMSLRKVTSDIEGHPTPRLDFIDVATGSLGQGLNAAAGMAYVGKHLEKAKYRVFCMMGDGEVAEGAVWEAFMFCSYYNLDNLVAIIDVNRLGQSQPTSLAHDMETYRKRVDAFGWNAIVVDGHDIPAICKALHEAETCKGKPTCLIAKTFKGRHIIGQEDKENFHGKPVPAGDKDKIIENLKSLYHKGQFEKLVPQLPSEVIKPIGNEKIKLGAPPNYKIGDKVAARKGYGHALVKLGKFSDRVISLDGDMKNSTYSLEFKKAYPGPRFIECFIAEQSLIGVAVGAGTRNRTIPFCSTFAAFFCRAYDHIRMAAVSQTNINLAGTHCGVAIGADGPSQMALEDIAMFRAIPNCTVFYPSDAVSMERAAELAANTPGLCFMRIGRQEDPILYDNNYEFQIGQATVLRQSENDAVTVVGGGVTLHEAIKAYDILKQDGIKIRVIDPFTLKPIDRDTLVACANATGGRVVTVEDHYPQGGLGGAVAEALADVRGVVIKRLAVNDIPRSGTPADLLSLFEIDAPAIVKAVKQILQE